MQIQKQNNLSFRQRYVIPYEESISDAYSLMQKIRGFVNLVDESSLAHLDTTNKKIYLATGKDEQEFLETSIALKASKENNSELISIFFKRATKLSPRILKKLETCLKPNKNYKIDLRTNPEEGLSCFSVLKKYLSAIGVNWGFTDLSALSDEKYLFLPIKDLSKYSSQIADLKTTNLTIANFEKKQNKITSNYVKKAQEFGKTDADNLINSVRKILGLAEI